MDQLGGEDIVLYKIVGMRIRSTFSTFVCAAALEPSARCLVLVTPVKTRLTDVHFSAKIAGV